MFVAIPALAGAVPSRPRRAGRLRGGGAGTGFLALVAAYSAPESLAATWGKLRDLGWLGWMFALLRQGERTPSGTPSPSCSASIATVIAIGLPVACLPALVPGEAADMAGSLVALRLIGKVGALVLVHTLYTAADPEARSGLRLPLIGLGAFWSYDLQLYTLALWSPGWAGQLIDLRGIVALLTAPVFGLALRRSEQWKMRLSRTIAFQSLTLLAILFW
jgi:hypothetical protein